MRRTSIKSFVIAAVVAAWLTPGNLPKVFIAHAQEVEEQAAGELDPTFGTGGKVTADFGGKESQAKALVIQADGKLIEAGSVSNATTDVAIARFNSDGTLDSSFGAGGLVVTDLNGSDNSAAAVVLQADGRIVIAGTARDASNNQSLDFALVRYNTDGSLDSSFGAGGKVITDVTGQADTATCLAILPGARMLVGGQTFNATGGGAHDSVLVRYNSDGSLDTSFGNNGKVTTDVAGFADGINALAIQADGKAVAAGFADLAASEGIESFALLRYNNDGTLDQSFGAAGKVTTTFSGQDRAQAIAITAGGKIVAAGSTFSTRGDFALARYNADGSLDESFGTGGKVTTDFGGNTDFANALCLQADNKIIAGGSTQRTNSSTTRDFALARYNADGSLDGTFGSAGRLTTDFSGDGDLGTAMRLQADGKLVFGGYSSHTTGASTCILSMVLARYTLGGATASGFSLAFEESVADGVRGTKTPVYVLINRTGGFLGNITITPPDFPGITPKPHEPIVATSDRVKFKL